MSYPAHAEQSGNQPWLCRPVVNETYHQRTVFYAFQLCLGITHPGSGIILITIRGNLGIVHREVPALPFFAPVCQECPEETFIQLWCATVITPLIPYRTLDIITHDGINHRIVYNSRGMLGPVILLPILGRHEILEILCNQIALFVFILSDSIRAHKRYNTCTAISTLYATYRYIQSFLQLTGEKESRCAESRRYW